MTPTIVILALIAAFLGLRLYSILGKNGREGDTILPRTDDVARTAPAVPAPRPVDIAAAPVPRGGSDMVYAPSADIGIRAILAADKNFSVARFLAGAQTAYRMILEAYWSGDRETLRRLCDDDSYGAFSDAIDARAASGEVLDNRLIAIDRATITSAEVVGGVAHVVVRFEADICAITRDSAGTVIAGSMSDAVQTEDVWSFSRRLDSRDPDWILDETDAD